MTFTTKSLSGSTDDKPIQVSPTTAATAVLIHTAVNNASDFDEVEIFANNHTSVDCEIIILIDGLTDAEEIRKNIPAKDTKLVLAGYKIGGGREIKVFAANADSVNIFGKVGRTTA